MLAIFVLFGALATAATGHPFGELSDGDSGSRIVGGLEAPSQYGTHMAALVYGDRIKSLICGGSIVSRRHILSAAHCIDPFIVWGTNGLSPSLHAVVGSNSWNSGGTIARISHYRNHPNYDWFTIKNDITVLYLTEDLVLNERVTIISLNFNWIDGGERSYVTGWGTLGLSSPTPNNLQLLYVDTISPNQCATGINEASLWWGPTPPLFPEVQICTFHSRGHGMCTGDSGSALVARGTGHQIGVVSWGIPCAQGGPDVFVRISGVRDFIVNALGRSLSDIKNDILIV